MYNIYVCNNCINNDECLSSQAKTKSFNNTDMPAKGVLTAISPIFFLQEVIHNNTFNALYILKYICI